MSGVGKIHNADLNKKSFSTGTPGDNSTAPEVNKPKKHRRAKMGIVPVPNGNTETDKQDISILQQNNINVQKNQSSRSTGANSEVENVAITSQQQPFMYVGHNPHIGVKKKDKSVDQLIREYHDYLNKWGFDSNMYTMKDQVRNVYSGLNLMGNFIDDPNDVDIEDVKKQYNEYMSEFSKLLKSVHEMDEKKMGRDNAVKIEIGLPKIMKVCEQTYESIICLFRIKEYANPSSDSPNYKSILKPPLDISKANSKQKLILRLLRSLSTEKLRNLNGKCWEEIYTPDGYPTQAYKSVCEIEGYIKKKCDRFLDPENWLILTGTSSKNTLSDITHTLSEVPDIDFPAVKLDRYKFSFANGIFVTKEILNSEFNERIGVVDTKYTCKFYPYDDPDNILNGPDNTKSSARYIDEDFIEYDEDMDWYDIPTPNLQSIFEYQFGDRDDVEEICRTMYALIGRTLFDRGDIENWEIITFIQGVGGTGKSTISKFVLRQFYDVAQIAELDNKLEKQFGIGPLALKEPFITIGDELDQHCQLDLTQFLKMVSGETITAAVKGKTPIYLEWPSHLWFSGNQLPPWEDKGGALSRRIVTIFFNRKVSGKHKDMRLGEKIKHEIPSIMLKCVRAYLELANKYSHSDFWHFCPKYFKETREELQKVSNIIMNFMKSDEVVYDESGIVLEKDFFEKLFKFAENNGLRVDNAHLKNKKFSVNSVIQEINDNNENADIKYLKKTVVIKTKKYPNVMVFTGIRLKQETDIETELFDQNDTPKDVFAYENDNEIQTLLVKLNPSDGENDGDDNIDKEIDDLSIDEDDEDEDEDEIKDRLKVDIEYAKDDDEILLLNTDPNDDHDDDEDDIE